MSEAIDAELQQAALHKELDLIQNCITRMANNSFIVKGWLIAFVVATFSFSDKDILLKNIWTLIGVPIIAFWLLDSFFLNTESRYRALHNWVITNRPKSLEHQYELNPKAKYITNKPCFLRSFTSVTIFPFYVMPLVIILLYKCDKL